MIRVCLYARYSTDLQNAASIEDQLRICREPAEHEGWQVVATYQDAAVSGGGRDPAPRHPDALAGCADGKVRHGAGGSARSRLARSSGRCDASQASAIRPRAARHAGGRRDQRAACRPQGHDERAVPERPREEDPSRPARADREGLFGRRCRLRLSGGAPPRQRGRACPGASARSTKRKP